MQIIIAKKTFFQSKVFELYSSYKHLFHPMKHRSIELQYQRRNTVKLRPFFVADFVISYGNNNCTGS